MSKQDSLHIGRKFDNNVPKVAIQAGEHPQYEARLASALIERWGMIMAVPDGEDSAGRQKLTLMPVGALVKRACDSAQQAITAFRARGWMLELPTFKEAQEIASRKEDEAEDS